ncbi:MAG: hypothetical protein MJ123_01300 [Lachnospiraceae bacterium]|nr:hypothetical protein [Lachnospiraceae bacterium]
MSRERKIENIEIGRRLSAVQAMHEKSDEYMAYLTGYSVHTYQCVCNGDHGISLKRLAKLAEDDLFASDIVYILTGKRTNFDYSIDGNFAYLETLSESERSNYLSKLALILSRELSRKN